MTAAKQSRLAQSLALYLAIGLAGPSLAAGVAPELPDPGSPRTTREQQKQLGLQVAGEVYKQMPVLPDSSPETKYIQTLGKRLVATIPQERSWPFQFHVVAQKEINAFALPGGPMFVNIGTITSADNEAELAGVMAHEMAHVYMQHSAKQQDQGSLLQGLAGLAGAIAGNMRGTLGSLAQMGVQLGAGTLMLKYSRSDEAQADAVGAIILWKAGFNPIALAEFFKKIEAQGGSGPQFLSDHPNPGNREAAIQKEIQDWPPRKYSGDSAEFASVRKHAAGVQSYSAQEIAAGAKTGQWAAENRKNGAVFPNAPSEAPGQAETASVPPASWSEIQPSSNFQTADLGALRIDRPENWGVVGTQNSSATIAPRAGVSDVAVAYGVVIRVERTPAANMSASQLTAAVVQSLRSNDAKMKQVGDIESIAVGGVSGCSSELESISPMASAEGKAQHERDWLVVLPRGQTDAIVVVFVSTLANYDLLRPTFERMLLSVRF
ncbi:MAG TPA: M48 family metallopeptidase [Candidatus Acidoferrales bacterium]|nr:M48 family metallopeptidase [Candidatus Acidoferrales bacterium]